MVSAERCCDAISGDNFATLTVKMGSDGRAMWEKSSWPDMSNKVIYRSSWWWSL